MTKLNLFSRMLLIGFLAIGFWACNNDDDEAPTQPATVVDIATGDAQFSTLVDLLGQADLVSTLQGTGPFTVFAPTDAAFTAANIDVNALTKEQLQEILLYHVVGGASIKAGDINEGQTYVTSAATTGPGQTQLSLLVEKTGASVSVNGANVTSADVLANNGVVHVIDKVLMPLDIVGHAAANSNFTQLVGALGNASGDLVSVLQGDGPFTVFAPLNSAFEAISDVVSGLTADQLSTVLTYHVASGNVRSSDISDGLEVTSVQTENFTINISGSTVTITDAQGNVANIILTDVQATNGVIHVLDKVILPQNL